ncbi:serine hydrolase domain-containing protein [Janthinobacterium sp. S3M3]|uniref:serine hydrolase domain-containing protein n=2 Tax=unclassified Janthinobacterium TaxID=2610881 RepID=UPI00184A0A2D|nr:serine hydrolase domain-containing protein [Janthinobacterium sp. S3M3]MBB5608954.1 CubicO group peptidase (beta-lactamase class C family) [Janthinobacterium sp. S3T4]MBB5615191.1 CubicO group peptidase (beta-lactamase class C family) [Janthinobacterium sp. S3M3]
MPSWKKYGVTAALFFFCFQAQAAAPDPALTARLAAFDGWVASRMAMERMPGMTIGFTRGGVEWVQGYGYADLENQVPATAVSSYRLASVTKPMTAVAILQLVEQGKVDLDAPVQRYVPYFPVKPFPVTVRLLLGHLAGIDAYRDRKTEQHFKEYKNTRQSIAVFEHFDLIAEPGTRYRYTSYGYNLLGAVIESASGESYGQYMQRHVWGPLGMTATMMDDPAAVIAHRVRGYGLVGKELKNSEFVDVSSRFSAGGTRSAVPDMLAFGQGIHDGKVLSPASLALMQEPMVTRAGRLSDYGMGWETYPTGGRYVISHSGQQPETATYLFSFPSRKLTIAVASNLERVNTAAFAERLFEVVTGEAWELKPYIAQANAQLYGQLAQGLFEEGRAQLEKTGQPYTVDPAVTRQAFEQINRQALQQDDARAASLFIADARHPAGGRVLLTAGSSMAARLRQAGIDLDKYSSSGPLAFVRDYIMLSQAAPAGKVPRFDRSFEQAMLKLAASWDRTAAVAWPAQPGAVAQLSKQLETAFLNQLAYPDFMAEINALAQASSGRGDSTEALAAGRLAVALYPLSDRAQALHGILLMSAGDHVASIAALRLALARDPQGAASATALNNAAYRLKASGAVAAGTALLQAAIQLHPRDANLHDTLGSFYVEQHLPAQAVQAYRLALRLDPGYPGADGARAVIARLDNAH